MKNKKLLFLIPIILGTMLFSTSCQKGSDDPVVSLKSRKDRVTNTWTLTKYEVNGAGQDISGTTYTYAIYNNYTITQTIEGSIFGFATRTVTNGTWSFVNDDEDLKVIINNDVTVYNIQRLATKELWLRRVRDTQTEQYYFEGL